MKKFDIRTRQGRARRRSSDQFNSCTLLPHTKGNRPHGTGRENRLAKKRLRWAAIGVEM